MQVVLISCSARQSSFCVANLNLSSLTARNQCHSPLHPQIHTHPLPFPFSSTKTSPKLILTPKTRTTVILRSTTVPILGAAVPKDTLVTSSLSIRPTPSIQTYSRRISNTHPERWLASISSFAVGGRAAAETGFGAAFLVGGEVHAGERFGGATGCVLGVGYGCAATVFV